MEHTEHAYCHDCRKLVAATHTDAGDAACADCGYDWVSTFKPVTAREAQRIGASIAEQYSRGLIDYREAQMQLDAISGDYSDAAFRTFDALLAKA
jgi:hypothetical protein